MARQVDVAVLLEILLKFKDWFDYDNSSTMIEALAQVWEIHREIHSEMHSEVHSEVIREIQE